MTKKKKNEMPVCGVTCSKCHSDEIVMNTDTKELVCRNCGQVTEPDLILNSKDCNVKEVPTISINDMVSRNEDNIDILDENTKRLFDMITKLEAKVDKLATGSNADKVPTDPEKCIENTISDLEYKIKLHTQHIEECYGTISRMKNDIDILRANDFKLNDDIKALRRDLGDLSVKTMKCDSDTNHITTFGALKVGDKFKLSNETTPYIKVRNVGDRYLAYNAVLFLCYAIQDDYPVVPIDDSDDVED